MHFQIFYALCSLAGQIGLRHTTFAHLKVRTGLFQERFLCDFLFDSISFARAGPLHPQPSYPRAGTSIARCQTWDLAPISGLKQSASVLDPMHKMIDGCSFLRRRRALARPLAASGNGGV